MRSRFSAVALGMGAVTALATKGGQRTPVWAGEARSSAVDSASARSSTTNSQPAPSNVPAYAPTPSHAEYDVIDAARLLGIPLVRTPLFPSASPAAFFCAASWADRQFLRRLRTFVAAGGRALLTSQLAGRLGRLPSEYADRIFILPSTGGPKTVLALPQAQVDRLRNFVLFPLGLRMEAPTRVSLVLIGHEALVIENQNPFAAGIKLTFLPAKWPAIESLSSSSRDVPLNGSTVSLQAPPKAVQRFRIVLRQ